MRHSGVKSPFTFKGSMVRALAVCLAVSCAGLLAEEGGSPIAVSPSEVGAQVGKVVTVRGRVDEQKTSKSGHTYLNFGGRYPNHGFSCFLSAKNFTDPIPAYVGKMVEVTGTVTQYDGKPQIELTSLSEIRVVEESAPDEAPKGQATP